jgi:predicted ATP-dependent serine protease
MSLGKATREKIVRVPCHWGGLDEAFGGGLARRHVVMLGGLRGSGKTRLMVPVMAGLAASSGRRALFLSAEGQDADELAAMLPEDVDADSIEVLRSSELDSLERAVDELDPIAVAVDSMQATRVPGARHGSDEHARMLLDALRRIARGGDRIVFGLSQMNGDGKLRGSQLYQQHCDAVAMLERDERGRRVFRFDGKNRGGPDDRTAAFRFDDEGILRGEAT